MLDALLVATGIFTQREVGAADRDTDVAIPHPLSLGEGFRQKPLPILGSHTQQVVTSGAGQGCPKAIHRLETFGGINLDTQRLLRIRLAKRYILLSEITATIRGRHKSGHRLRTVHLIEMIWADSMDIIQQDLVCRIGHGSMVITIQLIEIGGFVSRHLHHTPQIGGLLITPQQLHLSIAGDDHQRRCVGAYVIERCELIYAGLRHLHPLRLSIGEMANGMATVGHQSRKAVWINLVFCQPLLVQADHIGQIASSGMARDEDLVVITPIAFNLTECPGHSGRRIVDAVAQRGLRQQAIVHRHHSDTPLLQLLRHELIARGQASTMKPNDRRKPCHSLRIIEIQSATLLGIRISRCRVRQVVHLLIGQLLRRQPRSQQERH